jgi:hypothetical protein
MNLRKLIFIFIDIHDIILCRTGLWFYKIGVSEEAPGAGYTRVSFHVRHVAPLRLSSTHRDDLPIPHYKNNQS